MREAGRCQAPEPRSAGGSDSPHLQKEPGSGRHLGGVTCARAPGPEIGHPGGHCRPRGPSALCSRPAGAPLTGAAGGAPATAPGQSGLGLQVEPLAEGWMAAPQLLGRACGMDAGQGRDGKLLDSSQGTWHTAFAEEGRSRARF